jgi:hypothetical protein
LPEGDLAWFIVDSMEQMELREFCRRYREDGWGAAAYDPKMMIGVLLYAYCQGVRSSRKIAQEAPSAQEKLEQRGAEEAATGKKKRGRKPRAVAPTPEEEAKATVTDPDSRIMKTRQGYVPGYNVQAVVSEDQIIVAVGATHEENDQHQLTPMLQTLKRTLETAGIAERPRVVLADTRYWSGAHVTTETRPDGRNWSAPPRKTGNNRKQPENGAVPAGAFPMG